MTQVTVASGCCGVLAVLTAIAARLRGWLDRRRPAVAVAFTDKLGFLDPDRGEPRSSV
jgi:hypothetical protein